MVYFIRYDISSMLLDVVFSKWNFVCSDIRLLFAIQLCPCICYRTYYSIINKRTRKIFGRDVLACKFWHSNCRNRYEDLSRMHSVVFSYRCVCKRWRISVHIIRSVSGLILAAKLFSLLFSSLLPFFFLFFFLFFYEIAILDKGFLISSLQLSVKHIHI